MIYDVKMTQNDFGNLLQILKDDFYYAYDDGDEYDIERMQADIDLLKDASYALKDESAKMKLDIVISDYEAKLRSVQ